MKCKYYPIIEDGPVCDCGSDVSGTFVCTEEYSKTCQWAIDRKKQELKSLEIEILDYIHENQPEIYWDYRDQLSKEQILKILHSSDGLLVIEEDIWENNIDYIFELENQTIEEVHRRFDEKVEPYIDLIRDLDDWWDSIRQNIYVSWNTEQLIRNTPDLLVLIKVYSNYDCVNSWNKIDEPENYLSEVWQRVKFACNKEDYLREFVNTYSAELLCFVGKMSIEEILQNLKGDNTTKIFIPKGTQYGFFGDTYGSGSMFESETKEDFVLDKINEYDDWGIVLDIGQSYSMKSVYGDTSWVKNKTFQIIG
jgi:hypothetical protein